jgi:hypothetical protein
MKMKLLIATLSLVAFSSITLAVPMSKCHCLTATTPCEKGMKEVCQHDKAALDSKCPYKVTCIAHHHHKHCAKGMHEHHCKHHGEGNVTTPTTLPPAETK